MRLTYTINSEAVAGELAAKGDTLMDALEEAMGLAGESLYEAIMFNMSGGIIQSRTGLLASSVQLSPVTRAGTVVEVSAEIPDTGSFEHLVGMVLEFGGTHAYEIVPLENASPIGNAPSTRNSHCHPARPASPSRARMKPDTGAPTTFASGSAM